MLNGSEVVSVTWVIFFALFALAAFFFADRKRNKDFIEKMGAYIFIAVVLASVGGAVAGKFFSMVLGITWYADSPVNTTAGVFGIIISWVAFGLSVEWLIGLTAFLFVGAGFAWIVTGFIL